MKARHYKRVEDLAEQQFAAATETANAVIAAGAGSGKTTVLAARYVHLLETGRLASGERVQPKNILVLTFTRKAAAEMYARIYGTLAESAALAKGEAGGPRGDPQLSRHLDRCLASFSQAQISTFDAFASRLARSGSARFGLAPDFEADEDRAREAAEQLALRFLIEHRARPALRELVSALGFEDCQKEVFSRLALERMKFSAPPDFAACHARQGGILKTKLAKALDSLLTMQRAVLDYAGQKTTATAQAWIDAMEALGEGEGEAFDQALQAFRGLRKPSSSSKDEASLFLNEAVDDIRLAIERYGDLKADLALHPGRRGLYELLDQFREAWDEARRRSKILTFGDVARLAYDTLVMDAELRSYYQELYRFTMIDEFQDDDELQKSILFLLAARPEACPDEASARKLKADDLEPGKLFFVGDEKQSIYLFRGADVSVFRRLSEELEGKAQGKARSLSLNYRSEPGIIEAVNRIFPTVMAAENPEEGQKDYEASFEGLEARAPTPNLESRFIYLEYPRRQDNEDGEAEEERRSAAECEAWEIARFLRAAVESGEFFVADRGEKKARPARYEDFAVLLRSTGKQVHFEKYFRLFDIPYGSENACGLFSEAVACDLYYALRLALYPEDRNALAAFLRSPFVGLSDEATVGILLALVEAVDESGSEGMDQARRLTRLGEKIDGGERQAFARGLRSLETIRGMVDRRPIASILRYLWFEAGYRSALLRDPVASAFEEHFELLHSMAVKADSQARNLSAFVAELELLVGKPDKLELDLPRESSRGVRIMTIHKSKGLEFPIVILPQANNVGTDRAAREAWFWDEEAGPTFKPPANLEAGTGSGKNVFFEDSREKREAKERAELKRLLYVALTRAESHLIISSVEPRYADTKGRSLRSLLAPALGLFEADSPLNPDNAEQGGSREGQGTAEAEPRVPGLGRLKRLESGVLVGRIPERFDREYFALLAGARSRKDGTRSLDSIDVIERSVKPHSTTVTALAQLHEQKQRVRSEARAAKAQPGQIQLQFHDEQPKPPEGLSPELWGSLVHAQLEARLGKSAAARRSLESLRLRLTENLGKEEAEGAMAASESLAQVFLDSSLGRRALAAQERYTEMRIVMRLDLGPDSETSQEGIPGPAAAAAFARGSIDLAFIEAGRVLVVDFKTDAVVRDRAHEVQVAAYQRAAARIFQLPAEGWVFYLYGGLEVRVNQEDTVPSLKKVLESEAEAATDTQGGST